MKSKPEDLALIIAIRIAGIPADRLVISRFFCNIRASASYRMFSIASNDKIAACLQCTMYREVVRRGDLAN